MSSSNTSRIKSLWIAFLLVVVVSFSVLGYFGVEIYRKAPPIPLQVISADGTVLYTQRNIQDGQNVWQSIGGHELGSIWGHGAYVAPDWTADWLHREALFILEFWSLKEQNTNFDQLDELTQAVLKTRLKRELRTNTYNEETGRIIFSKERQYAFEQLNEHYTKLFMGNLSGLFENESEEEAYYKLRESYAMREHTINDHERMRAINAFFSWASWACISERPGKEITYTHNWPPDELVGNRPTGDLILWTGFSVMMLLLGIGILSFYYAKGANEEDISAQLPEKDPLLGLSPTSSMKATLKYFWMVSALFIIQIVLGVITAHYGVEGDGFYGLALSDILPYSVSRTWHVQIAIFWIATAWLATGLYMAPAVSGHEPKYQALGVNVLFVALIIVIGGSLAGEWLGVMQKLGYATNFWFGHQGYEYIDLGRFWQILLTVGLLLWLFLMLRALLPALRERTPQRNLLFMFVIASVAIAFFYMAGLMWGQHTHLSMVEYWRWWVVHLWVEGFFEVFATVISAFLLVRMQLLRVSTATRASFIATIIFLSGGIIGTFHHLYFTGTPTAVLALGATFSALEVVPLVFMGFEAYHNLKISHLTDWVKTYKWPIYFLISVSFWNLLGAGIFGFLINPPIALYYMQGLNTTPVHGHTALFGVYGMLGIGLMLFVLKGLYARKAWKEGLIRFSFWSMNIGLLLMVVISVLPIGLMQAYASVQEGLWFARSVDFFNLPYIETLKWLRIIGDTVFAIGALGLTWFIIGLATGHSLQSHTDLSDEIFPSGKVASTLTENESTSGAI